MRGDYSNGRIYFIEPICEHEENEVYYGSTLQKLCKRIDFHRSSYKSWKNGKFNKIMCFDLFEKYGIKNCKIYLIELFPCKSKEELESREGYCIRNYDCVNKLIPGRTIEEWRIDNKDRLIEYNKDYHESHKDKIHTCKNVPYECPCGGKYTHSNKVRHFKTKKHIQFIEQQNKEEIEDY